MPSVIGPRRTDNVLAAQRVIDMGSEILLLQPDAAPLTVILKNIQQGGRSMPAKDSKFSWLEDDIFSRTGVASGAHTNVATTINVVDGSIFPAESLALNTRTNEIVFVQSVAANALTVTRGASGSTAAAMNDQDVLYILGVADNEGDTSQPAHTANAAQVDNFTQIFKKSVSASGSWLSSSNVTSTHDWDHQRRKTAIEHLEDIELALLTGRPSADTGGFGTGPRRTTGGIRYFTTQNVRNAGGTLTEGTWEQWMRDLFRYGSSQKKVVFAAPQVISALNSFSRSRLMTESGDTSYGVRVMNLLSAHGEVTLVKHNLLGDMYSGEAIAVDFANGNVAYRYLAGDGPGGSRDTKLYTDRQAPDLDGRKDEWITECGLQFGLAKLHGRLTGVTGPN